MRTGKFIDGVDAYVPEGVSLADVNEWEFVRIGQRHGDELWTPAAGPLSGEVLVSGAAIVFEVPPEEYDPNE